MAKSIMVQGTSSGSGKTTLALALCRIFKQDGYKVAPFKSQNITSNTAPVPGGGDIAISQIIQAYAAGTEPLAQMNPLVLKLSSVHGSSMLINGLPGGSVNAYELDEIKETKLLPEIKRAYELLDEQYDIIVIEGAGSPVELNLSKNDLVNMSMAKLAKAPVLLVGDISRGGVFASLYGTISLFTEEERKHVKATVINKFRGDLARFYDGKNIIEDITGVPVAGILPYIDFDLPEEDDLFQGTGAALTGSSDAGNGNRYDDEFDKIAAGVREALDMDLVYSILNSGV